MSDRLLEVDGKPATRARRFDDATRRSRGTKVPIVFEREGVITRAVLELVDPL